MKNTKPHIEIPFPCHENWDAMSAREQGRHCQACSKTVVDFSKKSNEEILQYISSAKGNVCGRFHESQVKQSSRSFPKKLKYFLYAFAVIFLLQIHNVAEAQSSFKTSIITNHNLIYGYVTNGVIALQHATVKVLSLDGKLVGECKTDRNGKYQIAVENGSKYYIDVSLIGYSMPRYITIPVFDIDREVLITLLKNPLIENNDTGIYDKSNYITGRISNDK